MVNPLRFSARVRRHKDGLIARTLQVAAQLLDLALASRKLGLQRLQRALHLRRTGQRVTDLRCQFRPAGSAE